MWARMLTLLLGIWLIAAPAALGYGGLERVDHHIVGPLVAGLAMIAICEATRPLRWAHLPLGLWLIVAPLVLGGTTSATLNSLATGVLVAVLALFGGTVRQRFGGGWSALWKPVAGGPQ